MKYYLIAGEASGDLHAGRLMQALAGADSAADFRFIGGDEMQKAGGTLVRHYKEMAYMGFVPVLMHLGTIFRNMEYCKKDIVAWKPDVVILIDYPGFNLDIAKYLHNTTDIPVLYYISPKIWAWKEWRIRRIRRDIARMYSILPFETAFYERHKYQVKYVGNPTVQEVAAFKASYHETRDEFCRRCGLDVSKPIIALLAGSRKQEIKDNLPAMTEAASRFENCQMVLACAPGIPKEYYDQFVNGTKVLRVFNDTYALLSHSTSALVTSGTATLETCLFNVPQVVCYETPLPKLIRFAFKHVIKVKYISLVNLIADKEIVPEMLADRFTVDGIMDELYKIMPGHQERDAMLHEYDTVRTRLGTKNAPAEAAALMTADIKQLKDEERARLLAILAERREAERKKREAEMRSASADNNASTTFEAADSAESTNNNSSDDDYTPSAGGSSVKTPSHGESSSGRSSADNERDFLDNLPNKDFI